MKVAHQVFLFLLVLCIGVDTAQSAACTNNNWQPTFVHDLDNPDGPWYVTAAGDFLKLQIVDNWDWTHHACDLVEQSGIRDPRGYTNCQQYTRVQCGCQRGISEDNLSCARFFSRHNRIFPTLPYAISETSSDDVIRHPNPVMRHNQCRCEDWNNDGIFGVVLDHRVLSDNYGSYAQCISHADTLEECTAADVMRPSNQVMGGGMDAKIERIEQCKYASGGRPKERSHYNCKVVFSVKNTTDKRIRVTSSWYEKQDLLGKISRGRLSHSYLNPDQEITSSLSCTVPHARQSGTLELGGTGHHYLEKPTPGKEQFRWSLNVTCNN